MCAKKTNEKVNAAEVVSKCVQVALNSLLGALSNHCTRIYTKDLHIYVYFVMHVFNIVFF